MKITDYTNNISSFEKFQHDLKACLGERIFDLNEDGLCIHILHCLGYSFTDDPRQNSGELNRVCETFKDDFTKHFDYWENNISSVAKPTLQQQILFNTLDFQVLPAIALQKLESKVKDHLSRRQDMLAFYREHKFIQDHEKEGKKPEDQTEKTLLAFYNRNLKEQQTILDYLLKGIKTRALLKARGSSSVTYIADSFFDWPYTGAYPHMEDYFDHRRIDKVSHRMMILEITELRRLRPIYTDDKKTFYQELAKTYPPSEVYRLIRYYLDITKPLLDNRRPIFEELIALFSTEKYYGFYALALSQIEGIFTEILSKINPHYKKNSLPEKVGVLRSGYEKPGMHLDYYEHYIPLQRNRFMHFGLDEDIEVKALDLLYDLPHLLSVYAMIEIPIVKLTQLIKRRNNDDYINEEEFTEYFHLLDRSKSDKGFKVLEPDIQQFEKDFLSTLDLEFLSKEFEIDVPLSIKDLLDSVKEYTRINDGSELNLDMWTDHSIATKKDELKEKLKGAYAAHEDLFLRVRRYGYFLERREAYLPNMPEAAKTKFTRLASDHKTDLKKVKSILELYEGDPFQVK